MDLRVMSFANGTAPPQHETGPEMRSKSAYQPATNDSEYAKYIQRHPNHKFLSEQLFNDAYAYRRAHPTQKVDKPKDAKNDRCERCNGKCEPMHRTLIALYLRILDADRAKVAR